MKHLISAFAFTIIGGVAFSQTWEDRESLPASADQRHHPITFAIGNTGYLLTGTDAAYEAMSDFYAYDSETDSWEEKTEFPGGKRGFGYGVTDGAKGYVGFGSFFNDVTFDFEEYNDLWEYDPVSDTWTELSSCPCSGRSHPAMVLMDGKIFVGLGEDEFGDLDDWWEYDIATDTWTEKTDFPSTRRHHPFYFGLGGEIYVGFGHHTSTIFNDFYKYNPATDTWTTLNDFPGEGRVAGTQFSYLGKGYIISGQGEDHENLSTGEFWEYDPAADEWTALTAHPGGGRWAPGTFVIENEVYLACGQGFTGEKRDLMVYTFPAFTNIEEDHANFEIYPNPSQGIVTFKHTENLPANVQVMDASGRWIKTAAITQNQLDLSDLAKGIYFIQLTVGETIRTEKLIIE